MSPICFTNTSASGPVRYGQLPGSIVVLESFDKRMTIGFASAIGRTECGLSVWSLRIHGPDILVR